MSINLKRKIVRCEMFAEYNRRLYRKTQELEEALKNIEPEYVNLSTKEENRSQNVKKKF